MATNGSFAQQDQLKAAAEQYPASIDSSASNSNLSKDEVGWYFVEQYYTTLSKSPEKLHLFYGKRSQFVHGKEAEVANVSVGRQAIQERIKQLEFQDCKVRVSNVDAQATFDNIVIQVIGETSNKAGEPRKFVQTFVLAQQPSGYFVLNDMFRFIDEDDEEEATADAPAPEAVEPAVEAVADVPAVEPVVIAAPAPVAEEKPEVEEMPAANGTPEASTDAQGVVAADETVKQVEAEVAEDAVKQTEKPAAPTQTPAPPAIKTEAAPVEPAAPPKPMTWASRAAAAAGPRPVVPLPKAATPPAANQSRAAAPAPAQAAAPTSTAPAVQAPVAAAAAAAADAPAKEASGWQTAGADSKRQNRPQAAAAATEKEGTMGYVKYVTEKVQEPELRAALAAHGELSYFDINRQKNCAFVEYKTLEGYQAAISSNPHVVNGENIVVEPRRPKAAAYNGGNFGAGRGNSSARGRGNYTGQSRGRGGAARGRGGAQASNA